MYSNLTPRCVILTHGCSISDMWSTNFLMSVLLSAVPIIMELLRERERGNNDIRYRHTYTYVTHLQDLEANMALTALGLTTSPSCRDKRQRASTALYMLSLLIFGGLSFGHFRIYSDFLIQSWWDLISSCTCRINWGIFRGSEINEN